MSDDLGEPDAFVHDWPEIHGLQVVVTESMPHPRSIRLAVVGGPEGWRMVTEIDSSEPGARAKAVSLGEMLHDTIEATELAWFIAEAKSDRG